MPANKIGRSSIWIRRCQAARPRDLWTRSGKDGRQMFHERKRSPAQTGRTHGCSDQCCKVKILLANPEPMVWTPPLPGGGIPERQPLKGECHADRSYWIRSSQIYFRGSRSGCAREGRAPEDLALQCRVEPLCQPSTVSDWHGSIEWRPLLGKGTFRVRSPGPADQPPVRGTLRQVQQKRSQRC